MAKLYYHRFVVEGVGYFPLDMLRYDGCWPGTSEDVDAISYIEDGMKRRVQLTTIGHKDWKPTLGRWQSFGWEVLESVKGTEV